ncbi:MAG TPA: DUF4190 domain-containing protein [Candidatus Omnitrophica bacterium]|nr:DUF4190 domain-containing protein [Candidatus Omnitrophota bacterium]
MKELNRDLRWSKIAILAFISSLLGISTYGIGSIVGFVFGIISARKIKRSNLKLRGIGFSIAGIAIGGIGVIFLLWFIIAVIWGMINSR